jgi:hypothetical protein
MPAAEILESRLKELRGFFSYVKTLPFNEVERDIREKSTLDLNSHKSSNERN